MLITSTATGTHRNLISSLYSAVDALDAKAVGRHVTQDVTFRLGNFDQITGRQAFIDGNATFFETINGMQHEISGIWQQDRTLICEGQVRYTRRDETELTVSFAGIFTLDQNLISDYRVYVDISEL
ncbi:nuclear transport factor 2 family protein [Roseibium sp. SCP14]|uniref:nuclear transport factor 2 family protein n=1 Tax=Roseibium sp. SCP14 TaxID=3141375 RepID=UPI00333D9B24